MPFGRVASSPAVPLLVAGLLASGSARASAQGIDHRVFNVKPEEAHSAKAKKRNAADPMSFDSLVAGVATLTGDVQAGAACSNALKQDDPSKAAVVKAPPGSSATTCNKASLQDGLLEQRRRFRYLKKWVGYCTKDRSPESACTGTDPGDLKAQVDRLKRDLDDVLEAENLRDPFVAELVPGLAFETSAADSQDDPSTKPTTFIRWKSNPFGFGFDADRDLDFTLSGRLGYVPALTLVTAQKEEAPASTTDDAEAEEKPSVAYQEAFGWDARFNIRRHFGDHVQLVASAGGGQLILNTESTVGKFDGKDALFTTIPNGVGQAAFFWDSQLAVRYFKSNREVTGEQQGTNPGLELSFGYRRDTRFKTDPASVVQYDKPEDRWVFRFLLSDFRVIDRRKTKEAPTFTLTFGVEHEFGVGRNGVPSVTRILLVGDIAILRALNGNR